MVAIHQFLLARTYVWIHAGIHEKTALTEQQLLTMA
jgi:hypothetical protein